MITKIVQRFGNSGHIVLPKEYVGKRIKLVAEPKTFEDVKSEILEILKPYFEYILGVYLYGSYSRNEQTISSDIDILIITNSKLKIITRGDDYCIVSISIQELESILRTNAVLILPIIKEAKTIINPDLLNDYKGYKFTKSNTKSFIEISKNVFELNKKGLELNFELGSLVYSLMLRIRGFLMIKLILNDKLYSKSFLFDFLEDNGFSNDKIEELYKIYGSERNNIKVRKSNVITKEDISNLIIISKELLGEIKNSLR